MRDRGSVWLFALIILAVLVGGFVACDALIDDASEENDLGAPALITSRDRDHDGDDRSQGKNSRGKCENADYCQDNDGINADKVIICIQPGSCRFGEGEQAAMIKLDPVALVKTIQEGATAIGTAAGTMAGAIAAFPIGILL